MKEPVYQSDDNEIVQKFQNVYSPSTLLGVFANAIKSPADGRLLLARGEYQSYENAKEYNGYYYESIKSLNENKFIKAKIPSFLRSKLEHQNAYLFKGYIEKRIGNSAIELSFVVDDVLQKEDNQISEEEVNRFEVIQHKISKGYKDLEVVIKDHLYRNKLIRIANIYGNTAYVNKDFEKGLAEAKTKFEIKEFRCSLSSKTDLINLLQDLSNSDYDAIAVVRGGGDTPDLEIFNDSDVGEITIRLKPLLITAIGHVLNDTLIDKVADKKFHLPYDYGNSLKVWVNEAAEEQSKSKSVLIDQVKKDLTKTFEEQIKTLQTQLQAKNKEFSDAQLKFKEMIDQNQKDKQEAIQAKEKSIEAQTKSYQEQIKAKEESLLSLKDNINNTANQLALITAQNQKLNDQLLRESKTNSNLIIYLVIAAIIGFLIGLFA